MVVFVQVGVLSLWQGYGTPSIHFHFQKITIRKFNKKIEGFFKLLYQIKVIGQCLISFELDIINPERIFRY